VPADRDPQEDQEQGTEETRIVASRFRQGTAPVLGGQSLNAPAFGSRRSILLFSIFYLLFAIVQFALVVCQT
jgi:hypothetical protein